MKVFSTAILMVFCSLLGSAFSNKCLGCSSPTSTVCDAKPIDCPGDQCMTASQSTEFGGSTFNSILQGCANPNMCNDYGSVVQDPNLRIKAYASCCTGDNCNTGPFYIPEENTKPNGLKCPSAFCMGTTGECTTDLKMMECRGNETCCFDYRGRIAGPDGYTNDYSMKGCITPLACECNFKCIQALKEKNRVLLKCCNQVKP